MMRRRFKGSSDPNVIVLEDLFPLTNIKLSTELKEDPTPSKSSFREFVFEGEGRHLEFLETHLDSLSDFGWRMGDPLMEGDTELRIFRKQEVGFREFIEIPVLRSWHDLSNHFVLANRVKLTIKRDNSNIFEMLCDVGSETHNHDLLQIESPDRVIILPERYGILN